MTLFLDLIFWELLILWMFLAVSFTIFGIKKLSLALVSTSWMSELTGLTDLVVMGPEPKMPAIKLGVKCKEFELNCLICFELNRMFCWGSCFSGFDFWGTVCSFWSCGRAWVRRSGSFWGEDNESTNLRTFCS